MARTNLSLGNLYRAVSGSVRTTQAVSIGGLNGGGTNINMLGFATDLITVNVPTYTYIVESTTENANFTFNSTGSQFYNKVQQQTTNYTCSFSNGNFTVSSATYGTGPAVFPLNAAGVGTTTYSEASSVLTMAYADGYNLNATNYGVATTKTLYAVDVYNTINQPDFCLLFGTKVQLADGNEINVEDLSIGNQIKAWVPDGLPDENQPEDDPNVDWRIWNVDSITGNQNIVTVKDIVFNFASAYYSINNGLIKATGTHPLFVYDNEMGKYHFKNVENLLPNDKLINGDGTETIIIDIAQITEDVEIVTINVENYDVFLANGVVSHNKGTTTQPFIPASGLRMYLDPAKTASYQGADTSDLLDMSGWNTGFRPAGVSNAAGVSGANPTYNAGATRKEKYFSLSTNKFWYKDGTTNINGGYTQFNTSEFTVVSWVRFPSHPVSGYYNFVNKQDTPSATRIFSLYLNSNGSGTYYIHEGSSIQYSSNTFSLSTNVWYMVAYTAKLNGTNVGYLDGSSVGTTSNGAKDYSTGALLQIGGNFAENNYYFNGQMGPVLFYNRQLSGTEITQIYNYFSPTMK